MRSLISLSVFVVAIADEGSTQQSIGRLLGGDYFYTHFHAQPLRNWLNDPNGPMYFNGKYHLFFQYNPNSYKWGDMHWYHMVSTDLVRWEHLPVALAPDQGYDCGGIYSGSATIFHNTTTGEDVPVLTYSVACGKVMVNAFPANISDPNLINWIKPDYNPVILLPSTVKGGFRDPTTAWKGTDEVWRLLVGCGDGEGTCQFKSKDFIKWTYVGSFHSHGGGMWECPDFYRVPGSSAYVLKASGNENSSAFAGGDWWALGEYRENSDPTKADSFVPLSGDIHENFQKYDYGSFYASKTFYDPKEDRQVLFGWMNYHCAGTDWSGVQTFPRIIEIDPTNTTRIVMNPIKEIESLRLKTQSQKNVQVKAGASYDVPYSGAQLDVEVTFMGKFSEASAFGVRALVSGSAGTDSKPTPIGQALTVMTTGPGAATLEGQPFHYEDGKPLTLRVLVDHSVVEGYAQEGRAVTTRTYCPPSADATGLEVFNSGSSDVIVNITVHQLATANVIPSLSQGRKFMV